MGDTVWNFQNFSAPQILHEINDGHFEAPKSAILTILATLNFEFLTFSNVNFSYKLKIKASTIVKIAVIELLKSAKIDFT